MQHMLTDTADRIRSGLRTAKGSLKEIQFLIFIKNLSALVD